MNAPLPTGLQASLFGARQRLHIQHGPTDLVIDVDGPDRLILFEAALDAMRDVLSRLADELPLLRAPWNAQDLPSGLVAMRMHAACSVAGDRFVTPDGRRRGRDRRPCPRRDAGTSTCRRHKQNQHQ